MKKDQKQLIEKAIKANMSASKIALLSREDINTQQRKGLFLLFQNIKDFPPAAALKFVNNGGKIYMLRTIEKEPRYLTYAEYKELPKILRDDPQIILDLREFKKNTSKSEDSFVDFSKWFCDFYKEIEGIGSRDVLDTISDKELLKNRWSNNGWELDKELLKYYFQVTAELLRYAQNLDKEEVIKHATTPYKEKNYGTALERERYQNCIKKIQEGNLTTEDYLSFIRLKIGGKVYVKKFFKEGLTAKQAVEKVIENANKSQFSTREFYDLFSDLPDEIETKGFANEKEEQDVKKILTETNLLGSLKIPASKIRIFIPLDANEGKPIFLDFQHADNATISHNMYSGTRDLDWNYETVVNIIIFKTGEIYRKYKNVYAKITVRDVVRYFDDYNGGAILDRIFQIPAVKESYVLRDMIRDCREAFASDESFPSILWSVCLGYKNRNHFMKSVYKDTAGIDFNKLGIQRGYAYMKTRPFVDEKSQGVLYNAITNKIITGYRCDKTRKKSAVASAVISNYLTMKLLKTTHGGATNRIHTEVEDYVRNSISSKEKINLRWNSLKKVEQRNVDIVLANENLSTPKITIPKKSKFKKLSEKLPDCFEYIKTRERIILEGHNMRHCVASYADRVNRDECAIYHLEHDGCGYTIEFRKNGKDFFVNQIQSKADRGAPEEVWQFVEGELFKIMKKKPERQTVSYAHNNNFEDDIPF